MQLWFTAYIFDIGHPCYGQLTHVKSRYLLTSITWPHCGLKFRPSTSFLIGLWAQARLTYCNHHWVFRKPDNTDPTTHPGLKVNWSLNFSLTTLPSRPWHPQIFLPRFWCHEFVSNQPRGILKCTMCRGFFCLASWLFCITYCSFRTCLSSRGKLIMSSASKKTAPNLSWSYIIFSW